MNNIERERVHGRINTSFYMNRGDLEKVEQETGYDLVLIKKVTDKYRKRMKYDVSYHLANMMYDNIRIGSQQRTYVFTECLNQLRGATQIEVSACCGRAMVTTEVETEAGSEPVVLCSKCQKPVLGTKIIQQLQIYGLIKEYTEELRKEENHLLNFAKGMGITADNSPKAPMIQQNFVTMPLPDPHIKKVDATEEGEIIPETETKEIEELTPLERRKLCVSLEKKIIDAEVLESKEQEENEIQE